MEEMSKKLIGNFKLWVLGWICCDSFYVCLIDGLMMGLEGYVIWKFLLMKIICFMFYVLCDGYKIIFFKIK